MISSEWEAKYLARYNANLHGALATRYHRLDLAASVVSALAASSTLAASLSSAQGLTVFWQGILILAAITATLRPVMGWADRHARHAAMAQSYQQLEWRVSELTTEQAREELRRLASIENAAEPFWWGKLCKAAQSKTDRELQVVRA